MPTPTSTSTPTTETKTDAKSRFIHLHTHSHYSLLNALPKVDQLVAEAKKYGMNAIALTDAGNMYGTIEFYKECKKVGIKAIIGVDTYVAARSRTDMQAGIDNRRTRLVLLAKNTDGYNNLMQIVTHSYLEGFYYKPRIDHELMEAHSKGLIAIAPSFSSEISQALRNRDVIKAREFVAFYKRVFSNFYIEITRHPEIDGHESLMQELIKLARETNTPIVAGHDVYYLHPDDKTARDTLMLVNTAGDSTDRGTAGSTTMGGTDDEEDFSFISPERAEELFSDIPEAIENTALIAEMCDVHLDLGKWVFPNYILESGRTYDDELEFLAFEGFTRRNVEKTKEAVTRVEYELKVIRDKGYAPYFLVVSDLLKFAHDNGILTNIRGSVAGSLVTYLTGITNVNPLEYKLPFERFLNPERPSAPDIDMDYADNRRDEMIEYARRKYGHNNVAQIGTFGTMMAKGSVRDVARALGYPYEVGDRISKLIPLGSQGFAMTIDRALEDVPELKAMYNSDPDTKRIIDMAKKIEGCARHISVHAAGVVISPKPLTDYTPLQFDTKGEKKIISQYDMYSIEEAGLLKFDFLGIKNLSILADAVDRVKKIEGVDIDIENIPLDDKKTFEMLARGETIGLFQLNGSGLTRFLVELKPTTIHDINAMVALYRPGPLEKIPDYIERKHDPSKITYMDPRMKDILDMSYGVITYQDDVLMVAIKMAGYSWLEADKLRKAMGKKIPKEMEAEKEKLIKGFIKNGLAEAKAKKLWLLIEPFAAYGFNKCLAGDTKITDAKTGRRYSIREIYENNIHIDVHSVNEKGQFVARPICAVMENGVKDIFELETRSGKKIRATGNHPFYTIDGWKNLEDIRPGIHVATPRHIEIEQTNTFSMDDKKRAQNIEDIRKSCVLGYLLSEGNLCHPHGIYFYSTQENEISDFIKNTKVFKNTKYTIDRTKSAASIYCGQKNKKLGNELMQWISKLGLANKKATQKFIPNEVWSWDIQRQAALVGKMWQGDGCVSVENVQLYYATSSRQLADDMSHLLLRFGIISNLHVKKFKYQGGLKTGYTVNITHRENISLFMNTIGAYLIGKKKQQLNTLHAQNMHLSHIEARGTSDIIPKKIMKFVRYEMACRGMTVAFVANTAGISERLFSDDSRKIGYQSSVISRIAETINSEKLHLYSAANIRWDEIISITPAGKEMTYDLTVTPHHNFVANDILVHNSHAASYGRVAYQTAYLKANFPAIYMSAVLSADSGDVEKIAETIAECKRMGIPILPPDINESFSQFTVVKDAAGKSSIIRFGLVTIKNFGQGIATAIIDERKKTGPNGGHFKSLADFIDRVKDRNLNKKSLEALIKVGALDSFGYDRGVLLGNIETILAHNKERDKMPENQDSLFGLMSDTSTIPKLKLADVPNALPSEKLVWEKELLGLYISGHPLEKYQEAINKQTINIAKIKETPTEKELTEEEMAEKEVADKIAAQKKANTPKTFGPPAQRKPSDAPTIILAVIVDEIHQIMTKKNEPMLFIKVSDFTGTIEAVVFPRVYREFRTAFTPDACLAIKATVSERNGEKSLIIEKVKKLS